MKLLICNQALCALALAGHCAGHILQIRGCDGDTCPGVLEKYAVSSTTTSVLSGPSSISTSSLVPTTSRTARATSTSTTSTSSKTATTSSTTHTSTTISSILGSTSGSTLTSSRTSTVISTSTIPSSRPVSSSSTSQPTSRTSTTTSTSATSTGLVNASSASQITSTRASTVTSTSTASIRSSTTPSTVQVTTATSSRSGSPTSSTPTISTGSRTTGASSSSATCSATATVTSSITLAPSTRTVTLTLSASTVHVTSTQTVTSTLTSIASPFTRTITVTTTHTLTVSSSPIPTNLNLVDNPSFERGFTFSDGWFENGPGSSDAGAIVARTAGASDAAFNTAADGTQYLEVQLGPGHAQIALIKALSLPSADPSITWQLSFFWRQLTESGEGYCYLAAGTPGLPLSGVAGQGEVENPGQCSYVGAAGQDTGWVMWSRTFQLPSGIDPSHFHLEFWVANYDSSACVIGLDALSITKFEFQGN
jgi:hypothetical protein